MTPLNPRFAQDIEAAVLAMPVAHTLRLRFDRSAPGEVDLTLPYQDSLSFRRGQLQATPIFAAADFAAVSAAGTLLPRVGSTPPSIARSRSSTRPTVIRCGPKGA